MDPDGSLSGLMILLALALFLGAFFAMSETAIITLSDAKLRKMASGGHKGAMRIARLVEHPSRFFATIKIGATFSGFFAFALSLSAFAPRLEAALNFLHLTEVWLGALSYVLVGGATAIVILVLCELVPKKIAARHHENLAFFAAGPLAGFAFTVRPLVALLSSSSAGILRLLGIDPNTGEESVTEEEIRMLLDEGSEEGNIEQDDKDMINNIFDLQDTEVSELMIHRTDVVALERDATLREVTQTAVESGCTRIPVCEGDLDSIVGILHVKDLLGLLAHDGEVEFDISAYLREPFYAVESMSCKLLFSTLKEKKLQMAIVVDEYGGTAGIVTMEDLLEEIVGSIQDEHDQEEEEEISSQEPGVYLIDGTADLEEVCETLGLEPQEDELEEFETIGGYVIHKLGHIPAEGEAPSVSVGDLRFTVEAVEERRISKLRAEKIAPTE